MKIEGYQLINNLEGRLSGISNSQPNSISNNEGLNNIINKDDNIDISYKAIVFNKIKSIIKNIPEIRKEKIEGLTNEIRNGKYEVKAELIEPKLLREHIMDSLLLKSSTTQ